MSEKQHLIVDLKTGQTRPPIPRAPAWSSAGAPWESAYLEQHARGPVELEDVAPCCHVVVVQLQHTAMREMKTDGRRFRSVPLRPGQVGVFPAMSPVSGRTADSGEFLIVELDSRFLLRAAHDLVNPDRVELTPQLALEDPLLEATGLALKAEAEGGSPGGPMYAESLATTLAVHLVRRYSAAPPAARVRGAGLARHQLRRALDYIHDHLADEISLSTLAAAAGLSPFHFARLFKQSTGLAPHQYLIRRRIERAKELLVRGPGSVAEIALLVGFCDQSHLARHFKRIYGVSPRAFLQQAGLRHRRL